MKTLYILRHGETVWNTEARMQGRLDSPLTDIGREQASVHGRVLRNVDAIDTFVVSPSGRTRETANIVNSLVNAPLNFDERLMERDCGAWSGMTTDEIKTQFPDDWTARNVDGFHHRPPGGENLPDMLVRIRPLLESLESMPANTIALVTHGVMSRVIMTHYLGLTPASALQIRHPNNLFYRLQLDLDDVAAAHFLAGQGPLDGPLLLN